MKQVMTSAEFRNQGKPVKVSKYRNKKTEVDGIRFDSLKEARRYGQLKLMEQAGEISHLRLQVKFPIEVGGKKICTYIADFSYIRSGKLTVEDCKGMKTPMYNLKKKLVLATYAIAIVET
jgi:hypothetical protein